MSDRPKALDLFCGAGGATRGLQMAGFHVTGVDNRPQPRYCGDAFVRADALRPPFRLGDFDLVWASPPCQRYSEATPIAARANHPDLIAPTRDLLLESGRPYVIENVDCARDHLRNPFRLCGSMFGLAVQRHRWFETNGIGLVMTRPCRHGDKIFIISGSGRGRGEAKPCEMISALGVPWMTTRAQARQAIPPAYSHWIGTYALMALGRLTP